MRCLPPTSIRICSTRPYVGILPPSARGHIRPRVVAKYPGRGASRGGRRVRDGRASVRSDLPSGARAARCMVLSRGVTHTRFRERWFGRFAFGIVDEVRRPKAHGHRRMETWFTQDEDLRKALSRLDGETRTILVVQKPGNRNLELASRNLEGVKMVAPATLQTYDLFDMIVSCFQKRRRCVWPFARRRQHRF